MAKIKYADFQDYYDNDKKFFFRVLKDEVYKAQSKIHFADGTTYHVTKAGSRYWEYPGFGWKAEYLRSGTPHQHFYCRDYHKPITNEAEFMAAMAEVTANRGAIAAETVDIHPVMITIGSDKWVDPHISDWFEGQECPDDESVERDLFIHGVSIKARDDDSVIMNVWFKSNYMINKVAKFTQNQKNDPALKLDRYPYVCSQKVVDSVIASITTDTKNTGIFADGLSGSRFGNRVVSFVDEVASNYSYRIDPYSTLYGDKHGYWCE